MSDRATPQLAVDATRQRAGRVRLGVVLLCALLTAGIYVACVVVVLGGQAQDLYTILSWLAGTALSGWVLLALSAVGERSRQRIRMRRRRLTAEHLVTLAYAIGSFGDAERECAVRFLVKRLDLTRDALAQIAHTDAREQLVAAGLADRLELELDESHGRWHRVTAAGALGLLGSAGSIGALAHALEDRDPDVAFAAAQALAQYVEPAAYEALLDALMAGVIFPPRVAALLETFRCPEARELIERRADTDQPELRYWVAYLLGRLGDPRSEPLIDRLAHDPSEDVRANAAEALASFPNDTTLRRLLADESWVVRSHAAKTAGVTRQPALAPRLAALLEDRSWWVRQNAALALADLGDAAIPALVSQLRSEDRFARNKAAEVLVDIGYANEQVELLRTTHGLHGAARRALVDLGRAEALSPIVTAAGAASDPEFRAGLIAVLEKIGTDQATAALRAIAPSHRGAVLELARAS
jgi:HEAT repeat protein